MGGLGGFLEVLGPGTEEGLKNCINVFSGPLEDSDGPFERAFAAFDNLEDEELKQRIADAGTADLLKQYL
jgi:hypothetical protein